MPFLRLRNQTRSNAHFCRRVTKKSRKDWVFNPKGKSAVCILHEYLQQSIKKPPEYEYTETESAATPYSGLLPLLTPIFFFFCKKSFGLPDGQNIIPYRRLHISVLFLFLPVAPLPRSQTLEGLFDLTQHPSRALNLTSYIAFGNSEMQGFCPVCCVVLGEEIGNKESKIDS